MDFKAIDKFLEEGILITIDALIQLIKVQYLAHRTRMPKDIKEILSDTIDGMFDGNLEDALKIIKNKDLLDSVIDQIQDLAADEDGYDKEDVFGEFASNLNSDEELFAAEIYRPILMKAI